MVPQREAHRGLALLEACRRTTVDPVNHLRVGQEFWGGGRASNPPGPRQLPGPMKSDHLGVDLAINLFQTSLMIPKCR